MGLNEAADFISQFAHAGEDASSEGAPLQLAEPDLDGIEPGRAGRREVQVKAGMGSEEVAYRFGRVRAGVVDDQVQRQLGRRRTVDLRKELPELRWVRLFFVEDFSPYSWALLPANASLQWPFRGGHQAGQRVPASFRQPAEPRHGAEHRRSCPRQARSLLDIRAAFWYGAVGREADRRWL